VYTYKIKLDRVIDGDTIDAEIKKELDLWGLILQNQEQEI
jgi:hypothetical protein